MNPPGDKAGQFGKSQLSSLLMISGFIFIYWSLSAFIVFGNLARLGSLGLGFGLIMGAAVLRARLALIRHVGLMAASGVYFALLAYLTWARGHYIWLNPNQQIFALIVFCLFIAGYVLAMEREGTTLKADSWIFIGFALLAIVFQLAFLRFMKDVAFFGTLRTYGETELNPVGAAYMNGCLAVIFFSLGILNRSLWRRFVYFGAFGVIILVVLATGSRGAAIWSACTIGFAFILLRRRRLIEWKHFILSFVILTLTLPILYTLYETNYAVEERLGILNVRLADLADYLTGRSLVIDPSITVREYMWRSYLSTPEQWLILGERHYYGYPHNQWLEMLVRFGVLGIPLLVVSLFTFGRLVSGALRRHAPPDAEFTILALLFVFSYLQALTSLSLEMNRALFFGFGYFLGYYVNSRPSRMASPRIAGERMRAVHV